VVALVSPRWWGLAAVGCGTALGVRLILRRRRQRAERTRVGEQVLEACDLVAGELHAGSPVEWALERAARVCPLLVPAEDAGRLGADVALALRRAGEAPGADDLRLLAAAWQVAHRSGQGLAAATARIAQRLRAQRRTARVVEAELSSARATARLVAALPVVAWVMGAGTGSRPVAFLTGGPVGLVCLAAGLGLTVTGLWWIEALADEAAR
jgi:tight adherence protein B